MVLWALGYFDEIIPKALKQTVESTENSLSPDLADKRNENLEDDICSGYNKNAFIIQFPPEIKRQNITIVISLKKNGEYTIMIIN